MSGPPTVMVSKSRHAVWSLICFFFFEIFLGMFLYGPSRSLYHVFKVEHVEFGTHGGGLAEAWEHGGSHHVILATKARRAQVFVVVTKKRLRVL